MDQMPPNTPVMESKPGPSGWSAVWMQALTKPNEKTFVEITENPNVSSRTAYIWIFIAGTISGVIQALATSIRVAAGVGSPFQQIPGLEQYFPQTTGGGGSIGISLVSGLCVSPVAGLISVVLFSLLVAIIQWIAKLFGGTGTYEKLLYAFAAITVPFTIISSLFTLLTSIPFVGICVGALSIGFSIYALVLQVMAVKAVNRFGWGQATGSVFIPGCVVFLLCACVAVGGVMLLGPVIKDTFQGINNFAP